LSEVEVEVGMEASQGPLAAGRRSTEAAGEAAGVAHGTGALPVGGSAGLPLHRSAAHAANGVDGGAAANGSGGLPVNGTPGPAANGAGASTAHGIAHEAADRPARATAAQQPPSARRPGPPGGPGAAPSPDLVMVPARQGLEAVDILRRGDEPSVGPVIHDGPCDTLGFLVPPGTAAGWDVPGSACTETDGRGLRLPSDPPVVGTGWLLAPGSADGAVTDPARLREALDKAARTIEAADGHR
jgi:hypothetical protein